MKARFAGREVECRYDTKGSTEQVGAALCEDRESLVLEVRPPWVHAMLRVDTLGRLELPDRTVVAAVHGAEAPGRMAFLKIVPEDQVPPPVDANRLPLALQRAIDPTGAGLGLRFTGSESLQRRLTDLSHAIVAIEAVVQVPHGARFLRSTATHLLGRLTVYRLTPDASPSPEDEILLRRRADEMIDLAYLLSRHLGI